MYRLTDPDYVREQYKDASNLGVRLALYTRFSSYPGGLQRWVFDTMRLPEQGRILEVGCGPGGLWHVNGDRIPQGWSVNLTDNSSGMLEQARQNLKAVAHDFAFTCADIQGLPFGDAVFDDVIANHMLYHVPDKAKAMTEVRRVLKTSGRFYATTLGNGHLHELGELAHAYNPDAPLLWSKLMRSFGAENGADILAPCFSSVVMHKFEDILTVTEAGPLVDYIRSTGLRPFFPKEGFARFIEDEIERRGPIAIRSETVMFEAYNPISRG